MLLNRDQIMASVRSLKSEPVAVPAWGGTVHVRELSATELDAIETAFAEERQKAVSAGVPYKPNVRGKMLAACISDAQGQPIFFAADEGIIGGMAAHELSGLCETADRLNRQSKAQRDALEKKFEAAGGSDSASGSPPKSES